MGESATPRTRGIGDILAIGFGTTVAMWGCWYVCRFPGALAPAWLLLALMTACLLGGSWFAGRHTNRGVRAGIYVGLIAGLLNLMILGSLLAKGDAPNHISPTALWYLPGSLLAAVIVGGIGASIGWMSATGTDEQVNWLARFASVALVATVLLLSAGAIVTGYESGLAVPDWPNSYGYNMFLYPLKKMTGGVYHEHAHRLLGSLVGLTTLVLAIYVTVVEKRRWLRTLAWIALGAVIIQGILGGLRVTGRFTFSEASQDLAPKISLAIAHGVLAQVFFSLLVALRVFLSDTWRTAGPPTPAPAADTDRFFNITLIVLICVQLIIGALVRHIVHGLLLHIGMAVVVILTALVVGLRAWGLYGDRPVIPRLGGWLLALISLQLVLGVAALIVTGIEPSNAPPTNVQVVITTIHQTVGALLLGCSVALVLWNYRLLRPEAAAGASAGP